MFTVASTILGALFCGEFSSFSVSASESSSKSVKLEESEACPFFRRSRRLDGVVVPARGRSTDNAPVVVVGKGAKTGSSPIAVFSSPDGGDETISWESSKTEATGVLIAYLLDVMDEFGASDSRRSNGVERRGEEGTALAERVRF